MLDLRHKNAVTRPLRRSRKDYTTFGFALEVYVSVEKLESLKSERQQIVDEFEKARQDVDVRVQEKLNAAGLGNLLREAQAELEQARVKAQSRVDFLTGQISMLEEVLGVSSSSDGGQVAQA